MKFDEMIQVRNKKTVHISIFFGLIILGIVIYSILSPSANDMYKMLGSTIVGGGETYDKLKFTYPVPIATDYISLPEGITTPTEAARWYITEKVGAEYFSSKYTFIEEKYVGHQGELYHVDFKYNPLPTHPETSSTVRVTLSKASGTLELKESAVACFREGKPCATVVDSEIIISELKNLGVLFPDHSKLSFQESRTPRSMNGDHYWYYFYQIESNIPAGSGCWSNKYLVFDGVRGSYMGYWDVLASCE